MVHLLDAILLPIILVALRFALWAFWRRRRVHGSAGPLVLGLIGATSLVVGVVALHGVIAK